MYQEFITLDGCDKLESGCVHTTIESRIGNRAVVEGYELRATGLRKVSGAGFRFYSITQFKVLTRSIELNNMPFKVVIYEIHPMQKKNTRQAALLKIVDHQPVSSQEELVRLLQEVGYHATQSSISRDVRELGLVRVQGRYVPAKRLDMEAISESASVYKNELINFCEPVGANMIVLKTPIGAASAVAVELDRKEWPEIVGTVAGDDTIFLAVRSRAAQGRVLSRIRRVHPSLV